MSEPSVGGVSGASNAGAEAMAAVRAALSRVAELEASRDVTLDRFREINQDLVDRIRRLSGGQDG